MHPELLLAVASARRSDAIGAAEQRRLHRRPATSPARRWRHRLGHVLVVLGDRLQASPAQPRRSAA
jgi:hypothetical protein